MDHFRAMQYDDYYLTYENYALLLLLGDDQAKTRDFAQKAVVKFANSARLWLYLAVSSYELGDYQTAFWQHRRHLS